jgi:hypothetical protein
MYLGGIVVSVASMIGCLSITGLDQDFTETGGAGGGGAPAVSSSSGSSACEPLAEVPCYDGPAGTEGVGLCAGGTKTCNAQGTAYGACVGQVLPGTEDCTTLEDDEDCDGSRPPCPGAVLWSKRFGGAEAQIGSGVAVDPSGNVFVTGSSEGAVDFGAGPLDNGIFLAKFDPSGELLWAHSFGPGATKLRAGSVAVNTNGDCVITGGYQGPIDFGAGPLPVEGKLDVYLAAFDGKNGSCTFSGGFGNGEEQFGTDVVLDDDGRMTLVGKFHGSIDFGGQQHSAVNMEYDMFMARLDPSGARLWSHRFGDGKDMHPHNITFAGSDVVVTGKVLGDVDFFSAACGKMIGAESVNGDVFVTRFDTNGDCVGWERFGNAMRQDGYGLAADADGNLVVAGYFEGDLDFGGEILSSAPEPDVFVTKRGSAGEPIWTKQFGGAGDQRAGSAAVDAGGNIVVTGYFSGTLVFDPEKALVSTGASVDVFIARLDPSGAPLWSRRFGASDSQEAYGLALDPSGDVLVTGRFDSSITFDDHELVSAGGGDIFLAKLSR